MADDPGKPDKLSEEVTKKVDRKLRAMARKGDQVWFGLGMFGLVGWSIAIPTVIGIALGIWIDKQIESRTSWTLTLLFVGLILGCINAWRWIKKEGHTER